MSAEQLQDKVHKTKTFQMLADMAVSTAADAPPDVLARTIGVCGRLGCDQIVLDSLARHLITGVDKLQPEQMQQLERLQGLGSEVQQQQADSIKEGLRGLGHEEVHTPNPPPQEQTERIKYT
jgi:endonuclease III